MRGKDDPPPDSKGDWGITPAYAGKSLILHCLDGSVRDHPCVCGEKGTERQERVEGEGSPLRMRGKVLRSKPDSLSSRITPAYAGKRLKKIPILLHSSQRSCPKIFNFFLEP